jgi:site-specific recombinase XerD
MASIYFALSIKDDSSNTKEIRVRFKHGKFDQQAKTGIHIQPEYWNSETQEISVPTFRLMNSEQKKLQQLLTEQRDRLNGLKSEILNSFLKVDKTTISKDWLKLLIDKINFPEKNNLDSIHQITTTFFEYVSKFVKDAPERKDKKTGRNLAFNTIKQYKSTEKHLKEFANIQKKSDYQFSEIDFDFYTRFVDYLQKPLQAKNDNGKLLFNEDQTPILLKKSFTQNSVGKHIKVLKVMLNEAKNSDADISNFYVYTEDVDNVYLNETELKQLKDFDFSNIPHLDRVRDWFLLLAWTGSRFSDLEKIDKANIKNGMITYRQQKTNTSVTIPLHPVVSDILQKYNYQMPETITNQKFNEYIKEACKAAKIDSLESFTRTVGGKLITETLPKFELVSSHTCRRSFCTNMYLRGLDTLMIRSISGHKTEKSFLKYIKVSQQQHAEMMAKKWSEIYK